jgi:hypothetical protein
VVAPIALTGGSAGASTIDGATSLHDGVHVQLKRPPKDHTTDETTMGSVIADAVR